MTKYRVVVGGGSAYHCEPVVEADNIEVEGQFVVFRDVEGEIVEMFSASSIQSVRRVK